MKFKFTKMHGCGNDYIYIDCFEQKVDNPKQLSVQMSKYHFGIGSDGIILICPPDSKNADAKMRIFNQDGSEGKMCGNGIRCVGKYLYDTGRCKKNILKIETLSGIKHLQLFIKNGEVYSVQVDMGKASFLPENIPIKSNKKLIGEKVSIGGKEQVVSCVSMGNPHCVVFCDDVDNLDIKKEGEKFEHDDLFLEGVNTEFVKVINPYKLQMRVWERGSGETLACGTGACASVACAVENGYCPMGEDIEVLLSGGKLKIKYEKEKVLMTGEAVTVFNGEVIL